MGGQTRGQAGPLGRGGCGSDGEWGMGIGVIGGSAARGQELRRCCPRHGARRPLRPRLERKIIGEEEAAERERKGPGHRGEQESCQPVCLVYLSACLSRRTPPLRN